MAHSHHDVGVEGGSGGASLVNFKSEDAEKVHLTDGLVIQNINFKPVDGTLIYPHICFILYHL